MTTTAKNTTQTVAIELASLHQIETELKSELFEREEAIRAALVALVSQSHMVLLGPPGTGKSQLVRAISERFCDPQGAGLTYFVYLLTRFTTPEELFGPVSVHGLKNDTYERIIAGKLPEAQIAFLDEIFKSSSAVLNILLTILNERVFDNGTKRLHTPLVSLFGASNEMPQEAADLEALWDRFLIRLEVSYLAEGNFEKLLASQIISTATTTPTTMSQVDLEKLQKAAAALPIPQGVLAALTKLRKDLSQDKGIIASDRRWVQCLRLLQAHALIEGRDAVEEDDLAILSHVLWNQPEQRQDISRMVAKLANPLNAKAAELKDKATSIWEEARRNLQGHQGDAKEAATARATIALECLTKIKRIIKELDALKEQASEQGRPGKRIEQALAAAKAIRAEVMESADF
jgi:MoxR-like ATPase